MEHHHRHKAPSKKNILISILLNIVITLVEFIGGILSNSLSLISDALHNLSDTLAILLSYIALIIGEKPTSETKTFGYKRIEILAAFINSIVLIGISIYLFYEAYKRFINPEPIKENIMLIVASIGLLANLISVLLLHKDSHHNLNIKSAYLHLIGDTLSSVAVIGGAVLICFFKIYWIDPLLTVLIGIFIIIQTYKILKESINILMQASPSELNITAIKNEIEQHEEITNVHHIHTWQLSDRNIYFECHIDLKENLKISEADLIRKEVELLLKEKFKVNHTTIQTEYNICNDKHLINKKPHK